jgi:uncharacterized protein YgbK (DUF1537 family)
MDSSVVVVADDLTGAADTGVAFATPRTPVQLMLQNGTGSRHVEARGVRVIDTDTREVDSATARRIVHAIAQGFTADLLVFKKVDSMLRGNVATELDAMREAMPQRLTILAPAIPQLGRITQCGVQHMDGRPVPSIDSRSTERLPSTSDLCNLVRPVPVRRAGLSEVRSDGLPALLSACGADGVVALCDSVTDSDLDRVVAAGLSRDESVLWVGAAGLAAALARRLSPEIQPAGWPVGDACLDGRYLAVIGSMSETGRRQASALVEAGAQRCDLSVSTLVTGNMAELAALCEGVLSATQSGDVVVTVIGDAPAAAAGVIRRALAIVVAPAVASVTLLLLVGGATSRAVLTEMGVAALEVRAALAPGVVLAAATERVPAAIVLKAGALGDDRALLNAVLCGRSRGLR